MMTRLAGAVASTATIAQPAATHIGQVTRPSANRLAAITPRTNSRIIGSTKNA